VLISVFVLKTHTNTPNTHINSLESRDWAWVEACCISFQADNSLADTGLWMCVRSKQTASTAWARRRPCTTDLFAASPGVWGWCCYCLIPAHCYYSVEFKLPSLIKMTLVHTAWFPDMLLQAPGCIRLGWAAACRACMVACIGRGLHLMSITQCMDTMTSSLGFLLF